MPDPLLFLQAIGVPLIASVIGVLAMNRSLRWIGASNQRIVSILGMGLGVFVGFLILQFPFTWPPAKGLDRFLTIILPAIFLLEFAAGFPRVHPELVRIMRLGLIAASGRILLHGSIYVRSDGSEWSDRQLAILLATNALLLVAVWIPMLSLFQRTADISVPISIAMTTLTAGLLVMLAGYLKGGAAAFPLAGALLGTAVVAQRSRTDLQGTIGVGVMGLFSVLFIGRFFGGLTTITAVVVLLAPLLGWVAEFPGLRQRKPWQVSALRVVLVATPLLFVLVNAKRDFDRDMRPLLQSSFNRKP